jgi:integrase
LTREQAAALLDALPPLSRAMAGLAILSGLRRGEVFALRWQDIDREARVLTVREAVYDGTFGTPKTEAGLRQIPLSEAALSFVGEWKQRAGCTGPGGLVFSTRTGNAISPNNVLRREIFPAWRPWACHTRRG